MLIRKVEFIIIFQIVQFSYWQMGKFGAWEKKNMISCLEAGLKDGMCVKVKLNTGGS